MAGVPIADQTMALPMAGAAFVDRHLAPVAHSCSWAQAERLVEEALVRFDPEAAEARRKAAAESRRLGDLGDTDSLDVRRSKAAGELARRQWTFVRAEFSCP